MVKLPLLPLLTLLASCSGLLAQTPRAGGFAWNPNDPREGVTTYNLWHSPDGTNSWREFASVPATNIMAFDGINQVYYRMTWNDPTNGVLAVTASNSTTNTDRCDPVPIHIWPSKISGLHTFAILTIQLESK